MKKTAFIGHRQIFANTLSERLIEAIDTEIHNGCDCFTMGMHGQFDKLALNTCREIHKRLPRFEIELVITSLNRIKNDFTDIGYDAPYSDVKTVMYDIENAHYKQQIILSNRQMIDTCNTLICYVDEKVYRSGAKTAMNYAKKKGLRIVNLYREDDTPFYGMTGKEIEERFNMLYEKVLGKK